MPMVYTNGTEVKRDFTSNNTMLQFRGTFSFLVYNYKTFRAIYCVSKSN